MVVSRLLTVPLVVVRGVYHSAFLVAEVTRFFRFAGRCVLARVHWVFILWRWCLSGDSLRWCMFQRRRVITVGCWRRGVLLLGCSTGFRIGCPLDLFFCLVRPCCVCLAQSCLGVRFALCLFCFLDPLKFLSGECACRGSSLIVRRFFPPRLSGA